LSYKERKLFKNEGVTHRVKCHKEVSKKKKKSPFALTTGMFYQKEERLHSIERSGLNGLR